MLSGTTLWNLIEARADATPDSLMAVDEDMRTLTFFDLATEAERAAAGLAAYGVGEGTVVSWQLPTWIESLVLVAALARLGAVQNPVLPMFRQREVGFITAQAHTELIVVPSVWNGFDYEEMATTVARQFGGCQVLVADRALPQGDPTRLLPPPDSFAAAAGAAGGAESDADPVRWLFYTSGTTSDPKGARHTDASLAAVGRGMSDRLALIAADRCALVFPFTHIGGISWLFASLQTGCSLILMEAFDPIRTPDVLSREGVTVAGSGTPFHQAYLASQKRSLVPIFPNVRCFPGGGAPKPPQLFDDLRELFEAPILSGYGLTEAPVVTMASVDDLDDELAVSEGKPMPGVELRIITADGREAIPGEEGEIRLRAPQLMKGYIDSSLDAAAFDSDGWFITGDLGRVDDRGNLVVTGRIKDIIIRKGENVSAKEVEDLLFAHPAVGDVAVVGVPDAERGEMVVAVVALADGAAGFDLDEMVDHLKNAGLMIQKLPERLELLASIPRNASGKVLKAQLTDRFS